MMGDTTTGGGGRILHNVREGLSSSDEGFAEDLHSNNSDSSPQSLLDTLSSGSRDSFDAINVVVRVRPGNVENHESHPRKANKTNNDEYDLFPAAGQIQIPDPQSGAIRSFTFDVIFEPEASQEQVFEHSRLKKFIDMGLEGFACTVFAYGQTGSGKTFTMTGNIFNEREGSREGEESDHSLKVNSGHRKSLSSSSLNMKQQSHSAPQHHPQTPYKQPQRKAGEVVGIVQFTFAYLWEQIRAKAPEVKYIVTASFLEIYNEHVFDLLNPTPKSLQVRWSKDRGFYAENLFKVECEDLNDLEGVLREGLKNRSVRSHEMNQTSSRSHSLLTINLHSETRDPEDPHGFIRREGRICLVDLAGSEKTKRTQSKGETFIEANNINKSLLVLGTCIHSLSSNKAAHTPYRDSVLTKLLADSLSGSGMTLMIACVSAEAQDANESINTLRYASRAKKVKTRPIVRMDPRELCILSLKREVRLLKMENHFLRQQMNIGSGVVVNTSPDTSRPITSSGTGMTPADRQMMQQYMRENENLRSENARLLLEKDRLIHDQEESDRTLVRMEKEYKEVFKAQDSVMHAVEGQTALRSLSNFIPGKTKSKIPQEVTAMTRSKSKDDIRRPSILMGWDNGDNSLGLEVRGSNVLSPPNRSKITTRSKK